MRPDHVARLSAVLFVTLGECDAFDGQKQLVGSLEAAPSLCDGLNEIEDHQLRRLLESAAFVRTVLF